MSAMTVSAYLQTMKMFAVIERLLYEMTSNQHRNTSNRLIYVEQSKFMEKLIL